MLTMLPKRDRTPERRNMKHHMIPTSPDVTPAFTALLLACPKCTGEMVLFGVEAESEKRDLYSFECEDCAHIEVRGLRVK
jgi:hypothetical protein